MPVDRSAPPKRLPERWKRRWRSTLKLLRDQGTWHDELKPLLEAYIDDLRLAEHHRLSAERNEYVENDAGRVFAHPGFRLALDHERQALKLAVELGIPPAAQQKLGGVEASDPAPTEDDDLAGL